MGRSARKNKCIACKHVHWHVCAWERTENGAERNFAFVRKPGFVSTNLASPDLGDFTNVATSCRQPDESCRTRIAKRPPLCHNIIRTYLFKVTKNKSCESQDSVTLNTPLDAYPANWRPNARISRISVNCPRYHESTCTRGLSALLLRMYYSTFRETGDDCFASVQRPRCLQTGAEIARNDARTNILPCKDDSSYLDMTNCPLWHLS